jgi:hypothetical protein
MRASLRDPRTSVHTSVADASSFSTEVEDEEASATEVVVVVVLLLRLFLVLHLVKIVVILLLRSLRCKELRTTVSTRSPPRPDLTLPI